jgi:hypothetical protein
MKPELKLLAIVLATAVVTVGFAAGGYLLGESGAPSQADARHARHEAFRTSRESAEKKAFASARRKAEKKGHSSGKKRGAAAGTVAGAEKGKSAAAEQVAAAAPPAPVPVPAPSPETIAPPNLPTCGTVPAGTPCGT